MKEGALSLHAVQVTPSLSATFHRCFFFFFRGGGGDGGFSCVDLPLQFIALSRAGVCLRT